MSLYPQPNPWQCGPFALKHALLLLGIVADEAEISKLARTRKDYGTDEMQMERAARAFGCTVETVRKHHPESARRLLTGSLRKGAPVLLCIDQWRHWVTVARWQQGRFIILDSEDPAVLRVLEWKTLRSRWAYREQDPEDREHTITSFDLHPVVPRFRARVRPQLSIAKVQHLRRAENQIIGRLWNQYVEDLAALCKRRTPLTERALSLGEFLRRHELMILRQVEYWHGDIDTRRARRLMKDYRFVADTLGLAIPADAEKRTIAALSVLLTLWAEGERIGSPLYVPPKVGRRRVAR